MINKQQLLDLAERCEASTGPDRELDTRIMAATDVEPWSESDVSYAITDPDRTCAPLLYTSSIDAAMTLVDLKAGADGNGHGYWPYIERLASPSGSQGWRVTIAHMFARSRGRTVTDHAALALCAAALRARAENA